MAVFDRSAWREFRLSDGSEASKRHIDELALEESANIANYLLDQGGCTAFTTCPGTCANPWAWDALARTRKHGRRWELSTS